MSDYIHVREFTPDGSGTKFVIYVDSKSGAFKALLDGVQVADDRQLLPLLELLQQRTREAKRVTRAKVRVGVTQLVDGGLVDGFVYGIHAGTSNLMVEWEDGKKEQLQSYNRVLLRAMPADVRSHFSETAARHRADGRELKRLQSDYLLPYQQLVNAVTVALAEAEKAAGVEEGA